MESRDELHRLVDALPERQALLAKRLLEVLLEEAKADDPLLRALYTAPVDDEPVTPEEDAFVEEALRAVAGGEVLTDDELWKRLSHEKVGLCPPGSYTQGRVSACGDRER